MGEDIEGIKRTNLMKNIQKYQEHVDDLDKKDKKEATGKMPGGKKVKKIESDPTTSNIFNKSTQKKE